MIVDILQRPHPPAAAILGHEGAVRNWAGGAFRFSGTGPEKECGVVRTHFGLRAAV